MHPLPFTATATACSMPGRPSPVATRSPSRHSSTRVPAATSASPSRTTSRSPRPSASRTRRSRLPRHLNRRRAILCHRRAATPMLRRFACRSRIAQSSPVRASTSMVCRRASTQVTSTMPPSSGTSATTALTSIASVASSAHTCMTSPARTRSRSASLTRTAVSASHRRPSPWQHRSVA